MSYIKTEWETGDLISKERLNHIEDGIANVESKIAIESAEAVFLPSADVIQLEEHSRIVGYFVEKMNAEAGKIGLEKTVFDKPQGGSRTCAMDQLRVLAALRHCPTSYLALQSETATARVYGRYPYNKSGETITAPEWHDITATGTFFKQTWKDWEDETGSHVIGGKTGSLRSGGYYYPESGDPVSLAESGGIGNCAVYFKHNDHFYAASIIGMKKTVDEELALRMHILTDLLTMYELGGRGEIADADLTESMAAATINRDAGDPHAHCGFAIVELSANGSRADDLAIVDAAEDNCLYYQADEVFTAASLAKLMASAVADTYGTDIGYINISSADISAGLASGRGGTLYWADGNRLTMRDAITMCLAVSDNVLAQAIAAACGKKAASDIFIAYKGNTPAADVVDALDAGRIVVCFSVVNNHAYYIPVVRYDRDAGTVDFGAIKTYRDNDAVNKYVYVSARITTVEGSPVWDGGTYTDIYSHLPAVSPSDAGKVLFGGNGEAEWVMPDAVVTEGSTNVVTSGAVAAFVMGEKFIVSERTAETAAAVLAAIAAGKEVYYKGGTDGDIYYVPVVYWNLDDQIADFCAVKRHGTAKFTFRTLHIAPNSSGVLTWTSNILTYAMPPSSTSSDNGKVLQVVSGTPEWVASLNPVEKTSAMTQSVGKDASGKLWTAPSGGGGGEPAAYLKSASVSGNTLTLTNKDDTTVEFTPSGGSESTIAWLPSVDASGNISWQRSSTETAPQTRNIKGPQGEQGVPGASGSDGADGKSAYESAQDGGYTGTEAQFNSDLAAVSGKASTITVTTSASASGWSQQASGYYAQAVTATGITTDDNPIADVVLGADSTANAAYLIAWSKVMRIITGSGSVTLYASEEPQSAFTFQLKVVR